MDSSISEDDIGSLCFAIGLIAFNWAMIERQLDNWVHLICADLGGLRGENEKPIALDRKIRALKKAFKTIPELSSFRSRGVALLTEAKDLGLKRHAFIHGCVDQFEGTTATISKIKLDKNPLSPYYEIEKIEFDFLNFPELLADFVRLVGDCGRLSSDLLNTIPRQHSKPPQPRRK